MSQIDFNSDEFLSLSKWKKKEIVINEFKKCKNDFVYFVENYAKIRHPKQGITPIKLFDYQYDVLVPISKALLSKSREEYIREISKFKPKFDYFKWLKELIEYNIELLNYVPDEFHYFYRITYNNPDYWFYADTIILKSRRTGLSTGAQLINLWDINFHTNRLHLVISQRDKEAKEYLSNVRKMYELIPAPLRAKKIKSNDHELYISLKGRDYLSGINALAPSPDAGRSFSPNLVVLDEFAMYKNADEVFTAVSMSLATGGILLIISTPKGVSNLYYKLWQTSKRFFSNYHITKTIGKDENTDKIENNNQDLEQKLLKDIEEFEKKIIKNDKSINLKEFTKKIAEYINHIEKRNKLKRKELTDDEIKEILNRIEFGMLKPFIAHWTQIPPEEFKRRGFDNPIDWYKFMSNKLRLEGGERKVAQELDLSFELSGETFIPMDIIKELRKKSIQLEEQKNKDEITKLVNEIILKYDSEDIFKGLNLFEPPKKDCIYLLGIDVSEGIGKDYSVITILKVYDEDEFTKDINTIELENNEKVYIPQIVGYYSNNRITPLKFTKVIVSIAKLYNNAFINFEKNNPGLVILSELTETNKYDYPQYLILNRYNPSNNKFVKGEKGWRTTKLTKSFMESQLKNFLMSYYEHIRIPEIYLDEMITYYENTGTDDHLISLMLSIVGYKLLDKYLEFIQKEENKEILNSLFFEDENNETLTDLNLDIFSSDINDFEDIRTQKEKPQKSPIIFKKTNNTILRLIEEEFEGLNINENTNKEELQYMILRELNNLFNKNKSLSRLSEQELKKVISSIIQIIITKNDNLEVF